MIRRILKILLAFIAAGAVAVLLLFTRLWTDHNRDVTLPRPSGQFAVARATDWWHDDTREVFAWIWYPAVGSASSKTADYLPPDWRSALTRHRNVLVDTFLARDPVRVHPHSLVDVAVSPEHAAYPVVILRGGLGALITDYTTLAEDLASHGFIVVGFDAPRLTGIVVLPDGRVLTRPAAENPETLRGEERDRVVAKLLAAWTANVGFAVDQLARLNASAGGRFQGRFNLRALGVAGHSLGGATAAQFCHVDARCRAAIDIDGAPLGSVVKEGLRVPLMFLFSDHSREHDEESREIAANVQRLYDRLPPENRVMIAIRGVNHFSFSDQILVRPPTLMGLLRVAGVVRIEPRRGLAIAAEYVRRFFDVHLKGAPPRLLKEPAAEFPELEFEPDIENR